MFCKKAALKTYAKLTRKHRCWSLFFIKFQGFSLVNVLKRDSETGICFPVNLVKFLRTPILRTSANCSFCISNTTLGQTTLQNPSGNIAEQQKEEYSLKVKVLNLN